MTKKRAAAATRKIDDIDRQIIATLKEDGRMPFAQIAQRLGVSPGMVRQRFHRLVQDGVLQVVPVTNPTLMGYHMMALIGVRADGNRIREIARQLASLEEVIYLVLCTGTYDILVEVICRDNAHLLQFLTERLRAVEGVRDTETFMCKVDNGQVLCVGALP
jgi:Lrp/AsnC family transcriptional regulator for asnA, asnC and gidA